MAQRISKEMCVDTFCPRVTHFKKTKSGKRRFTNAMFPCYLFAKLDLNLHLQDVRGVFGVSRMLTYGDRFPVVPEGFLRDLRDGLDGDILHQVEADMAPETRLRIARGAFEGLVGSLVCTEKGGDRLVILMNLLGNEVSVRVSVENALPVGFA